MEIEYRLRPVTRYIVTRWQQDTGSSTHGEFENPSVAYDVAYALCRQEHDRLGYARGDERIQYPRRLGAASV